MKSVLLVVSCFKSEEYLKQVAEPWLSYKDLDVTIFFSHGRFKGTESFFDDYSVGYKTKEIITDLAAEHMNVWYSFFETFKEEAEARNEALKHIVDKDYIHILDDDEIYTHEQIKKIYSFVERREAHWYSINFKNYVFDKNHYIEGFCPPRIFSTNYNGAEFKEFYYDNDAVYYVDGMATSYKNLSNLSIPKNIAFIDHYSWLSDERGKNKVEYQNRHFPACSYAWDEKENKLIFNEEYFKTYGIAKPEVLTD